MERRLIPNCKALSRAFYIAALARGNIGRSVTSHFVRLNYRLSPQAIGIALESRRLDIVSDIYKKTRDVSLLSYAMDAVLDTGFSLSYRNEVLKFLLPLFPLPSRKDKSPHVHSLTRLLVSLGSPELTVPYLKSFVPNEKLLAYQLAFDLVEGGAQDFLESIRTELPEGDAVSRYLWHSKYNY